jgi:hypothetical protein
MPESLISKISEGTSEEEVVKLIKIANAGVKEIKHPWWALGIPINFRYSLDEQIEAVKKLSEFNFLRARDYLKKIVKIDKVHIDPDIQHSFEFIRESHPYAKGQLYKALVTYRAYDKEGVLMNLPLGIFPGEPNEHPRHKEAIKLIDEIMLKFNGKKNL